MTDVFFKEIEANIINQLMLARYSIKVAVAWINSKEILNVLCWKLKSNIKVELVLHYDDINSGNKYSLNYSYFKRLGGKLFWVKELDSTMHTKYCIIDNLIVLHGSCNWTHRAFNKNIEAFNITRGEPKVTQQYIAHFEKLKMGHTTTMDNGDVSSVMWPDFNLSEEELKSYAIFFFRQIEIDEVINGSRDIEDINPRQGLQIEIPDAFEQLQHWIKGYQGDSAYWLPAYHDVVNWLSNNRRRGLLCRGPHGVGKTLICRDILPKMIKQHTGYDTHVYSALEMLSNYKEMIKMKKKIIYIDDIGSEPCDAQMDFSTAHPFDGVCDACEQHGNILIVTTNLFTEPDANHPEIPSLLARYGNHTIDRLCGITTTVSINDEGKGQLSINNITPLLKGKIS